MKLRIEGTQMSHNKTLSEEERKRNEIRGMGTPRSCRTRQGQAIEGFSARDEQTLTHVFTAYALWID